MKSGSKCCIYRNKRQEFFPDSSPGKLEWSCLTNMQTFKMLCKGISMKIEILKESHLTCRTVLHFSEYGFSHENIYDQVITIIQWLAKTELSTTSSYNQYHENQTISIFHIYFVELTTARFHALVKSMYVIWVISYPYQHSQIVKLCWILSIFELHSLLNEYRPFSNCADSGLEVNWSSNIQSKLYNFNVGTLDMTYSYTVQSYAGDAKDNKVYTSNASK
jgi:hypothetical protein